MKMALTRTLIWKEMNEARWQFYIASMVLLLIPACMTIISFNGWVREWERNTGITYGTSSSVLNMFEVFGAIIMLLFAVTLVSRDLRDDGQPDAWQLLPMGTTRFLLTKFLTGALIVLMISLAVMVLDSICQWAVWDNQYIQDGISKLSYALSRLAKASVISMVVMATYAVTFCLTSWTRRVVPAVMLSGTLVLLLYFLPLLIPSLGAINLWRQMDRTLIWTFSSREEVRRFADSILFPHVIFGQHIVIQKYFLTFLASQLVVIFLAFLVTLVILKKQWVLKLGVSQLAWFFVTVGLLLFAVAAVQVGNNLVPEEVIPVTNSKDSIKQLVMQGNCGVAMVFPEKKVRHGWRDMQLEVRRLDLSQPPGSMMGKGYVTGYRGNSTPFLPQHIAWSDAHPDVAYLVDVKKVFRKVPYESWVVSETWLQTLQFDAKGTPQPMSRIDLTNLIADEKSPYVNSPGIFCSGTTLWVYNQIFQPRNSFRITRIDISQPSEPRLVKRFEVDGYFGGFSSESGSSKGFSGGIVLPRIDGISEEDLWEIRQHANQDSRTYVFTPQNAMFFREGLIFCERTESPRHGRSNSTYLQYQSVSKLQPTPLEKFINAYPFGCLLQDDYLYILINQPQSGVVVYDVHDLKNVHKVGYYYAPGEQLSSLTSLGDGRIAAAGHKLHIFNPKNW